MGDCRVEQPRMSPKEITAPSRLLARGRVPVNFPEALANRALSLLEAPSKLRKVLLSPDFVFFFVAWLDQDVIHSC